MKVSIGFKFTKEAYGGGNNFVKNLTSFLLKDGHEVINHLNDDDIDIIMLFNPLKSSEFGTFNNFDIDYYQKFVNKNSISIQRFNECDERKGTININDKLRKSNVNIDFNVFVSSWLSNIFEDLKSSKPSKTLLGGPSKEIFNLKNKNKWTREYPVNLVTHHWSSHPNKGYSFYKKIDGLLDNEKWRSILNFTIIGNVPEYIDFKNTKIISPKVDKDLSKLLKSNDIYITASKFEPSGNHHMEAAMCGLPILYIDSGGTKEYCENFGIEFDEDNFEKKFFEILEKYDDLYDDLRFYPYSFDSAYEKLIQTFETLISDKTKIVEMRPKLNAISVLINLLLNKLNIKIFKIFVLVKILVGKILRES